MAKKELITIPARQGKGAFVKKGQKIKLMASGSTYQIERVGIFRPLQEAAVAARPYSTRMAAVLSNLASAMEGRTDAPLLLAGTGKDQVHLLLVCTGERGLSGAFNSSIVRLAREHALSLMNQGKEVKIFCVGRKGYEQLRRTFDKQIIETVELRSVRQIGFGNAEDIAQKVIARFNAGEFDVCTIVYNRFKSVISQIVTAQQLIPVALPAAEAAPASPLASSGRPCRTLPPTRSTSYVTPTKATAAPTPTA